MKSYLFLFTIGPVQSFITQARRTQDLYAGSKLLSDLIDTAIETIKAKTKDPEFAFPSPKLKSKPNRFIVLVKDDIDVKMLGSDVKTAVQNKFKKISSNIFSEKFNGKTKPANFDEQIKYHLQIYWTALPYDGNNYTDNFKSIEASLGAIKNIRAFDQLPETGRKCSLCGERNALIFYSSDKDAKVVNSATGLLKRFFQSDSINVNGIHSIKYSLSEGEGLCAVCLTKRFYEKENFPSTAEVSLMESINKLSENKNVKEKIDNYKNKFSKLNEFDYQLFYEENLTTKYFKKQNIDANLEEAQKSYKEFKEQIKKEKLNKIKFSSYYALVMFDGDSMGEWLSGENLDPKKPLLEFHRTLSKSLGEFAKSVYLLIDKSMGRIVFAGGEDFLAFINLNHLFESLKLLRELFDCKVGEGIKDFKQDKNDMLSFSTGIIVAHYKDPLSEVLKWARAMEKEAKGIDSNKNAFALTVLKHSGEINKSIFKWGEGTGLTSNLNIINTITSELKNDNFSNSFIKNLTIELSKLINSEGGSIQPKCVETELKRLLKRSCNLEKKPSEDPDVFKDRRKNAIKELAQDIMQLYSEMNAQNFIHALNIAEFISRHLNGELK